jgi:hypothetical protein
MKEYNIKITGTGTFEEITKGLLAVVNSMEMIIDVNKEPMGDIEWEDPILITEIREDEK